VFCPISDRQNFTNALLSAATISALCWSSSFGGGRWPTFCGRRPVDLYPSVCEGCRFGHSSRISNTWGRVSEARILDGGAVLQPSNSCAPTRDIRLQSCARTPVLSGPRIHSSHSQPKYESCALLHNSSAWSAPLAGTFVSRSGLYYSSFFSGSLGSAFSIGLRGSIWSRMAAS
jgi:hypothetical protein